MLSDCRLHRRSATTVQSLTRSVCSQRILGRGMATMRLRGTITFATEKPAKSNAREAISPALSLAPLRSLWFEDRARQAVFSVYVITRYITHSVLPGFLYWWGTSASKRMASPVERRCRSAPTVISSAPLVTTRFSAVPGGWGSASSLGVGREAQLVELDRPGLVEGEERAGREGAVVRREDLGPHRGHHRRPAHLAAGDQRGEGHAQGAGDLPEHVDGRRALPELDLPEHGPAHARRAREALQREAPLHPEAAEVAPHDGREIARRVGGRDLVGPGAFTLPIVADRGRGLAARWGALALRRRAARRRGGREGGGLAGRLGRRGLRLRPALPLARRLRPRPPRALVVALLRVLPDGLHWKGLPRRSTAAGAAAGRSLRTARRRLCSSRSITWAPCALIRTTSGRRVHSSVIAEALSRASVREGSGTESVIRRCRCAQRPQGAVPPPKSSRCAGATRLLE